MNRKLITYINCAIIVVYAMVLTVISPLLADISKTFSVGMTQSGILFTTNFVGFVAFVMIGGIFSDRLGKKPVLIVSLAGFTVSLLLFPLSTNYLSACIVMFFMGGFGGIIESASNALVADINPVNTSFYINLVQVFFGLGAIAGPVAAGVIVSSAISWKVCYYVLSALSLAVTVAFAAVRLPELPKAHNITPGAFKYLVTDKKFLLICLCMVFYTGSEVGSWGWLSTFLKDGAGFSMIKSSIAVAVFWAAMTLGRLLCGSLTLRYDLKNIIIVLAFLSSIVTAVSGFLSSEAAIWTVTAVMGLTYSSQWPLIVSYGSSHADAPSGTVFALLTGSGSIGSMIVPYLMGFIGENVNTHVSMISPAILLLAIGLIFLAQTIQKAPRESNMESMV